MITKQIIVTGKVQGVFFRKYTLQKAEALGITGHVENVNDGTVNIIATGTAAELQQLINWCRQGPPKAQVTQVKDYDTAFESFDKFVIL